MAWTIPTVRQIGERFRAVLRQELPGTDALVWPNTNTVFAKVLGLMLHETEQRIGWLYRQLFLTTANGIHLERHAREVGLTRKPAARAVGMIETTGSPGAVYPAGVAYLFGTATYVTTQAATAATGTGALSVAARAVEPGLAGNLDAGAALRLASPLEYPSLAETATVAAAGFGGGADRESDESLRQRGLIRKASPPQGGSEADYEQFALAVPGVARAFAKSFANGPGTVGVWFLFEGRDNGIPTAADVAAVQGALDDRRLIRAYAFAAAPTPTPVDLTITLDPSTALTQAAVTAALAELLDATAAASRIRPGLPDDPFVLSRSWISEAISGAAGENAHDLVAPSGNLTFTAGQLPVLGTIAWA